MKLISKITILVLFLRIIFSVSTGLIYAQESEQLELPKITVQPGSFYYPFKRLIERGRERLIFSKDLKRSFYISLLKARLAELDYVTSKRVLSEIQRSSERFAYQAGILTEELIKQDGNSEKENLIKEFDKYAKFLANLRDKYPANSSFWMLVQHDINALNILTDRLQ